MKALEIGKMTGFAEILVNQYIDHGSPTGLLTVTAASTGRILKGCGGQ